MHDRTPELIGNYSAITNAYNEEFSLKIKNFLEKINFTGICHFDVEYDVKRKKFYVFEMNIRQGRSNFYTYASGANLMSLIVDDYIYNKNNKFYIANEKFTVSIIPKFLLKYCLKKNGKTIEPGKFYRFGISSYDRNILRYLYQAKWDYRIVKGYLKYNK
jgi:D-aspartate ligase